MDREIKITKHGHACLFVEKSGRQLVIDPGCFSELPPNLANVEAVIITHIHRDHLDKQNLSRILEASPSAELYGPSDVIEACQSLGIKSVAVDADMQVQIADLDLNFYHVDHAVIYGDSPCKNLALRIGNELYYPGDSLYAIDEQVKAVAVPLSAPWLKTSEYIDFALAMKAKTIFPVHNGLLNSAGQQVMARLLKEKIEAAGKRFQFVEDGSVVALN